MILRTTKICLLGCVAGLAALLIVVGGVATRLAYGPIEMNFLTPELERAFGSGNDSVRVRIDRTVLTWAGWARTLDLRITGVQIVGGDGFVAEIPQVSVTLSALAAVRGRLAPSGLEFISPVVVLARDRTGGIDVGFGGDPSNANRADLRGLFRHWLHGAPGGGPLEYLRRISISDADLGILDARSGASWGASRARLAIRRHGDGLAGEAAFTVDVETNQMPIVASISYRRETEIADIKILTGQFNPSWLAPSAPEFPILDAIDVPVTMSIDTTTDLEGRIGASTLVIEGGGGHIRAPRIWDEPVPVFELEIVGEIDRGFRGPEALLGDPLQQSSLNGRMAISLPEDGQAYPVDLSVLHEPGNETMSVDLDLYDLRIDRLAAGLVRAGSDLLPPALSPFLQAAEIPVSGQVSLDLGLDGRPRRVWATARAKAGRIVLPNLFDRPLELEGAKAEMMYDVSDGGFAVNPLSLRIGDGALTVYATGQGGDSGELSIAAHVTDLAVVDLVDWWPYPVAEGAGVWLAHNAFDGTVAAADVWVAGERTGRDVTITDVRGELDIDDAKIGFLLPMPAATKVYATGEITKRELRIELESGEVNGVRVSDGGIRIWDLSTERHEIEMDANIAGPLRNLLEVIDTPPFRIVSRVDMGPSRTSGQVEGTVRFAFPLLADLPYEAIDMDAKARVTDGVVREAALGADLTAADLDVELKAEELKVSGAGRFAGAPIALIWQERLIAERSKLPFRSRVRVAGDTSDSDRAAMGFGFLNEYVAGPVLIDADLRNARPGQSRLSVKAGLDDAEIDLDPVLWRKPAGEGASVAIEGTIAHEGGESRLTGFTFEAVGRELAASGETRLNATGDDLERTVFDHVVIGRTSLHSLVVDRSVEGRATFVADGAVLDIEPYLDRPDDPTGPVEEVWTLEPEFPFELGVDLHVDALRFGENRFLRDLDGVLLHDGTEWRKFKAHARTSEDRWARLDYLRGRERDELIAWFDDFGAFLRIADIAENISGGTMAITGGKEGALPDSPMRGRFEMRDYRLLDAPALANVLSVASLTGILDALSAEEGMAFSKLEGRYGYSRNVLSLEKSRTFSSSLGVTAEGELDLNAGVLDLEGTFAPAYLLSQILGSIPIVGEILAGSNGEGLFAANVYLTGSIEDPDVSVNPLSALAPGILRNLFDEAADQTASDPDAYLDSVRPGQ